MQTHTSTRTLVFLQEEYGCYGTSLVSTTATVEEIRQWWSEGGFHPCSGEHSGHLTRELPGKLSKHGTVVWKKELDAQPGWSPVSWPKPGDVFHKAELKEGVLCYDSEEFEYGAHLLQSVFIHFHMGEDDFLCVGEEEIPHPHAEAWARIIFQEE